MTAAGIDLRLARREAERELTDWCRIVREGEQQFNEDTGRWERAREIVYDGPCALRNAGSPRELMVGGVPVDTFDYTLKVPVAGTGHLQSDDVAEITASRNDPSNVGRKVRVKAHRSVTHTTVRRLPVSEVTQA